MDFAIIDGADINAERFWAKVDKRGPDECWPWLAYKDRSGHGQFRVGGRMRHVHRVAYALEHGACDAPLLRHLCGSPACCNPAHLVPGTRLDNAHDRREHGTWGRGALTEENVLDIIELLQVGFEHAMIAEAYGCSQGHVSCIATGKTWTWVRPDIDRATLRRRKSPTKITDEIRAHVHELRSQGLSQRAIARRVGVSQATVYNILKRT